MIIDAFLFNDELDMLEFRLRLLGDVVDAFVIVEADHTFSGKHKPSLYTHYRSLGAFDKYAHKIRYEFIKINPPAYGTIPTQYDPAHPCWVSEQTQRRAIGEALGSFASDDLVLMGDIDEIPSLEAIAVLKDNARHFPIALHQFFFYYDLTCMRQEYWIGTVACTVAQLRDTGAQRLRDTRYDISPLLERAGWHLSYFGGTEAIKRKLGDFSHREYDRPEFTDDEHICSVVKEKKDLFKRDVKSTTTTKAFFPGYFKDAVQNQTWWGGSP